MGPRVLYELQVGRVGRTSRPTTGGRFLPGESKENVGHAWGMCLFWFTLVFCVASWSSRIRDSNLISS